MGDAPAGMMIWRWSVAVMLGLAGCPDPASDGAARADANPPPDMRLPDAATDPIVDAAPDALLADAQADAAPPDPCALGDVDPQVLIGPVGGDPFVAWGSPAILPLTQLAQGGAVTRFDLLALGLGEDAAGITVSIIDRASDQELAFGESGPARLPCRPGVGRALVDRAVDYGVEFVSDDLIGREVRLIVTVMTADGPAFGAVDGVLEAAP